MNDSSDDESEAGDYSEREDDERLPESEDARLGHLKIVVVPSGSSRFSREKVKIISNWNFKGGVGKTTFTFGLAYALAHTFKKKVLMVDADPQKNLTQLVARYYFNSEFADDGENQDEIKEAFNEKNTGLYQVMRQAMRKKEVSSNVKLIRIPVEMVGTLEEQWKPKKPMKNQEIGPPLKDDLLYLLPGSYETALLEKDILDGYRFESGTIRATDEGPYPAIFWNLMRKISSKMDFDYVLVDLSPAISYFNTNILFSSDIFVVPVAPELFSVEALKSLPCLLTEGKYWSMFKNWRSKFIEERETLFHNPKKEYYYCPSEDHCVQFAGTFVTKYQYKKREAKILYGVPRLLYYPKTVEIQKFFDDIRKTVSELVGFKGLPVEMLRQLRKLGWTEDNPENNIFNTAPVSPSVLQITDGNSSSNVVGGNNERFRLVLDVVPEMHEIALIAQRMSIPMAYLPNRIFEKLKDRKVCRSKKLLRWSNRQAYERVVKILLEGFFNEDLSEFDCDASVPSMNKRQKQSSPKKGGKKRKAVVQDPDATTNNDLSDELVLMET